MKKISLLAALLLLILWPASASMETYQYRTVTGYETTDTGEDLGAHAPEEVLDALARAGFGGWRVLDGVQLTSVSLRDSSRWENQSLLLAVESGEERLLLWGRRIKTQDRWPAWTVQPVSDVFLRAGEDADLRVLPLRQMQDGAVIQVLPAVCYGADCYYVFGGNLLDYRREESRGTGMEIHFPGNGVAEAKRWENGRVTAEYRAHFLWPRALEFWNVDAVPRSIAALQRLEAACPFPSPEEFGIAKGGNFRREATGSSESIGEFASAPVRVLGSRAGKEWPWYHVTVGEMEGWVSFPYLDPEHEETEEDKWAAVQPVGQTQEEAELRDRPGGAVQRTLPAGQMMHILLRKNDWLYVAVPQGAVGWTFDPDAAYGWVDAAKIKTYASPLQARYQQPEAKLFPGK